MFAWNFYQAHATGFARVYGLMSDRMRRVGYQGAEEALFFAKLAEIHEMMTEINAKRARGAGENNG